MNPTATFDRLSGILERFRLRARLHHAGELRGLHHFDAGEGHGYLHVLRRGQLAVSHPGACEVPQAMQLDEPTLLLYPRPFTHHFHNPPTEGADFTCARLDFEGGPGSGGNGPFGSSSGRVVPVAIESYADAKARQRDASGA